MSARPWHSRARGATPRFVKICRNGENNTPPLEMLSVAQHRKIFRHRQHVMKKGGLLAVHGLPACCSGRASE